MNKRLMGRIFGRTILVLSFAVLGGYGVFTSGNSPTVLAEDPAIFYLVLGTYILSVILVWLGQTLNEIRFAKGEKTE